MKRIYVIQKDIDLGEAGKSLECPISLACDRQGLQIEVLDDGFIYYSGRESPIEHADVWPPEIVSFIQCFDATGEGDPFVFDFDPYTGEVDFVESNPPLPKQVAVQILERHINDGVRRSPTICPVSLAFASCGLLANVCTFYMEIGDEYFRLPALLENFVRAFDRGEEVGGIDFTFNLESGEFVFEQKGECHEAT